MNWATGLFRLWIVGSVLWLIWIGWATWPNDMTSLMWVAVVGLGYPLIVLVVSAALVWAVRGFGKAS